MWVPTELARRGEPLVTEEYIRKFHGIQVERVIENINLINKQLDSAKHSMACMTPFLISKPKFSRKSEKIFGQKICESFKNY